MYLHIFYKPTTWKLPESYFLLLDEDDAQKAAELVTENLGFDAILYAKYMCVVVAKGMSVAQLAKDTLSLHG